MSIDSCQNKKPADPCHMTTSRAKISLWGCLLNAESRKMAPKENKQVNLGQLRHAAYILAIWYGKSISWSIDSCQDKVSVDRYRMTVTRAKV